MTRPSATERAAAWGVHAYTTVGVLLALAMVDLAYQGRVQAVLVLFGVAMVVDGTDGFLARRFRVKTVVPMIDGALLDNIIDYLTYVFAPVVLLLAGGYLPGGWFGHVLAGLPLVASCYQFCRVDAKTEDHFFLGFPSYWNVAAFYVVVLPMGTTATAVLLLVLTALVFVPVRYLYPSRTERWWELTMTLSALWLAAYCVIVALVPDAPGWLVWGSLAYVAYYVVVSVWFTMTGAPVRTRRGAGPGLGEAPDADGVGAPARP